MKYIEPAFEEESFTCPHCNTVSWQSWKRINYQDDANLGLRGINTFNVTVSRCLSCTRKTLWVNKEMVYPILSIFPKPNSEMPATVLVLYNEAGEISNKSPRGACALLRLALQTLCVELGEEGKDLNTDVKNLVKKGLPEVVQQSLDVVRVVGNKAVHPGQIELDVENKDTVDSLFELINIIVEYMIAMPNRVGSLYTKLPTGAKEAIEKRDK